MKEILTQTGYSFSFAPLSIIRKCDGEGASSKNV